MILIILHFESFRILVPTTPKFCANVLNSYLGIISLMFISFLRKP
jgi:hypothetical protein